MQAPQFPDGSHLAISYDAQGRLTTLDDGSNPVVFSYLLPGGYTVTDGVGSTTTILVDITGLPASIQDPLGHVEHVSYNSNGQPILVAAPDGASAAMTYDSKGDVVGAVDPLGNTIQTSFAPKYDNLQTFQEHARSDDELILQ